MKVIMVIAASLITPTSSFNIKRLEYAIKLNDMWKDGYEKGSKGKYEMVLPDDFKYMKQKLQNQMLELQNQTESKVGELEEQKRLLQEEILKAEVKQNEAEEELNKKIEAMEKFAVTEYSRLSSFMNEYCIGGMYAKDRVQVDRIKDKGGESESFHTRSQQNTNTILDAETQGGLELTIEFSPDKEEAAAAAAVVPARHVFKTFMIPVETKLFVGRRTRMLEQLDPDPSIVPDDSFVVDESFIPDEYNWMLGLENKALRHRDIEIFYNKDRNEWEMLVGANANSSVYKNTPAEPQCKVEKGCRVVLKENDKIYAGSRSKNGKIFAHVIEVTKCYKPASNDTSVSREYIPPQIFGQDVGGFDIVEGAMIGKGGLGCVYKVYATSIKCLVQ